MPPDQAGNPMSSLILMGILGTLFYFIVLFPEKKKQDDLKNKISKLQKNDSVITSGGIHGTVVNLKEKTVIIRVDDNVKIEVDREAITAVPAKS